MLTGALLALLAALALVARGLPRPRASCRRAPRPRPGAPRSTRTPGGGPPCLRAGALPDRTPSGCDPEGLRLGRSPRAPPRPGRAAAGAPGRRARRSPHGVAWRRRGETVVSVWRGARGWRTERLPARVRRREPLAGAVVGRRVVLGPRRRLDGDGRDAPRPAAGAPAFAAPWKWAAIRAAAAALEWARDGWWPRDRGSGPGRTIDRRRDLHTRGRPLERPPDGRRPRGGHRRGGRGARAERGRGRRPRGRDGPRPRRPGRRSGRRVLEPSPTA